MKEMQKSKLALVCAAFALVVVGCKNSQKGDVVMMFKQQKGEPLAEVGTTVLTVEEMRTDFQDRQGSFKGAPNLNTDKARSDYIENQVMQEAMFQKAVASGFVERVDVKRDIKKIVVQKFVQEKLKEAQNNFVPNDQQMQEHFDNNKNLYNREEAVKVAYVSIAFGEDKNKAKEIATIIQKDAAENIKNSNTKDFARLAVKHSSAIMKAGKMSVETNETDYLEKAPFEAKFGSAAFETASGMNNIGQISPLVTTNNSYMVMMKTGYRKALNETFVDAKSKITKRLAYENRNEYYKKLMDELRAEYKIKIYNERLADLSKGAAPKEQVAANTPKTNPTNTGEPAQAPDDQMKTGQEKPQNNEQAPEKNN